MRLLSVWRTLASLIGRFRGPCPPKMGGGRKGVYMKMVCPVFGGRCAFMGTYTVDCPYHQVCPVARHRQQVTWRLIRRGFEKEKQRRVAV